LVTLFGIYNLKVLKNQTLSAYYGVKLNLIPFLEAICSISTVLMITDLIFFIELN